MDESSTQRNIKARTCLILTTFGNCEIERPFLLMLVNLYEVYLLSLVVIFCEESACFLGYHRASPNHLISTFKPGRPKVLELCSFGLFAYSNTLYHEILMVMDLPSCFTIFQRYDMAWQIHLRRLCFLHLTVLCEASHLIRMKTPAWHLVNVELD